MGTNLKALVIPADPDEEMFTANVEGTYAGLAGVVCPVEHGYIEVHDFSQDGFAMIADEEGMLRGAPTANPRAMSIFATLSRRSMLDFVQPLVGTWAVVGRTGDGEMLDGPSPERAVALMAGVLR